MAFDISRLNTNIIRMSAFTTVNDESEEDLTSVSADTASKVLQNDSNVDRNDSRSQTFASEESLNDIVNFDSDSLLKGIIYKEILGEPRSRKGFRR